MASVKEQVEAWLNEHPEATVKDAIWAGVWIECDNWINKTR